MDNASQASTPSITLYTTATCSFCKMAKEYFGENNIEYTEVDVSSDPAAQQKMIEKSGQMGVPVIDINGEIVVGFDKPRIEQLLHSS